MPNHEIVILGGGMVAGYLVKKMAALGRLKGRVAIVSADPALPYERPPLSKTYLEGSRRDDQLLINNDAFYRQHEVALHLGRRATRLDLAARRVELEQGEALGFEKLVLATGGAPCRPELPGAELEGVFTLRSLADARALREAARGAGPVVILGGGFIAMETAAMMRQLGHEVTVVTAGERLGPSFFSEAMTAFFTQLFESRGIRVLTGRRAAAFSGERMVMQVTLESGEILPADVVIAGLGIEPAVELFQATGLELHNGVVVNEFLETNQPGVYAAGDVAFYYDLLYGIQRRLEHWDNAVSQGEYLGAQLAAGPVRWRQPYLHVPYFFSDIFEYSYEMWGNSKGADQAVMRGRLSSGSFSIWWLSEGRVIAAFVMNRAEDERRFAHDLIYYRTQVPLPLLIDDSVPLDQLAA